MSTAGLINRYVWFVTTIYNRGPATRSDVATLRARYIALEELQHRFESQALDYRLSLQTTHSG